MKRIEEDLKSGKFKQIYLLYGEEVFLVKQYRDKLKNALSGGDTMNTAFFDEKIKEAGPIIEYADTYPFFAERRVIILQNVKLPKDESDRLAEYLANPAETAYFIIVEGENVDKRTKLYKNSDKNGCVVKFERQEERILRIWSGNRIKAAGLTISEADKAYFINLAGNDMTNLECELEKLISYCLEKKSITRADIDEITVVDIKDKIFDLIEAVVIKNREAAMKEYRNLRALQVAPSQILALLVRQFNILAGAKAMRMRGMQPREIAAELKVLEFVVNKALKHGAKITAEEIRDMLELCAQAEYDFKSGLYTDVMSLELLIANLTA